MALKTPHQLFLIALFFLPLGTWAQDLFKKFASLFTQPKNYTVNYTQAAPNIDGDLNDPVWQQARWTDDFVDIQGELKPRPPLKTNVKMLWGDSCLYIAARIADPHVWAYLSMHDQVVFHDNDFEVFLNPNNTTHQYFEIEYNARNTIFDLFLNKPYRNGGNAMISWNVEGLQSAVKIQGTLNNPSDTDEGWTLEMAIPFRAISLGNDVQLPQEGTLWRINFSRVEWGTRAINGKYEKLKDQAGNSLPEQNWVWSPQGLVNMHFPERWGYLTFSKNKENPSFHLPYSELQRRYLWLVYYNEQQWRASHHTYTQSLPNFGLTGGLIINKRTNKLHIEASAHQFMAIITDEKAHSTWSIDQQGLIRQLNSKGGE